MQHNFKDLNSEDLANMIDEIKDKTTKLDTQIVHYKHELTINELMDKNGCFNGVFFEGSSLRRVGNAVQIKKDEN
jgi:hypothetical protein